MRVHERILSYNAGRDAELVARKYARMAQTPFVFLRGSCHLFYADWKGGNELDAAPLSWISGDLHLENFGSYKGDNRLAYFDLNDFDEAALAPCTWEVARFLTSILVAAHDLPIDARQARALCRAFLNAYAQAMLDGKARWIERSLAIGMIGQLLQQVGLRKRKIFLQRRTQLVGERRKFVIDGEHLLPMVGSEREKLLSWLERFGARQPQPKFFRVLDLARRAAGTGSLGLPRYVALVRGKGSPNGNYLLDLKLAGESSAAARLVKIQPRWASQADRIVTVQKQSQAIAPAFLMAARYRGRGFVIRELQPIEDKLDLAAACADARRLAEVIETMARLVAWSALRSAGRHGSASADDLIAFAVERTWRRRLLEYAESQAARTVADWRNYRDAWRDGAMGEV